MVQVSVKLTVNLSILPLCIGGPLSKGLFHLRASPVVIQACQTGEILFGDGWGGFGRNQTVSVGWVTNN